MVAIMFWMAALPVTIDILMAAIPSLKKEEPKKEYFDDEDDLIEN